MATENNDIRIDTDGDDLITDGDFAIGDGSLDDCLIIFGLNKGNLKSDPLLAPEIIKLMNTAGGDTIMKQRLYQALQLDGKQPTKLDVSNGNIDFQL